MLNVDELVTAVLMVVVGAVAITALYLGLMGFAGAVVIIRCQSCDRWTFSSAHGPSRSCQRCHHPVFVHAVRLREGR